MCGEHRQVGLPEGPVIEPGFVLYVTDEGPHHAANRVRRPFADRLHGSQFHQRVIGETHAVRQFEQRIDQPACVRAGGG